MLKTDTSIFQKSKTWGTEEMESKRIILLTGYEAFGDFEVNPSIAACIRLDGRIFNGYKIVVELIAKEDACT